MKHVNTYCESNNGLRSRRNFSSIDCRVGWTSANWTIHDSSMKLTSGQFFIFRNDGAISKNKAKNASETNKLLGCVLGRVIK